VFAIRKLLAGTRTSDSGALPGSDPVLAPTGRGRRFDNIFIERLWRTGKYEEVRLKGHEDGRSAARSLGSCFGFHNREQLHESLNCRVPEEARFEKSA
jgi:putative transposase